MSCKCNTLLNGGIAKGCENNTGGVAHIYITDYCNISSVSEGSPAGQIQTITLASGAKFYEFAFNRNTSDYTEKATVNIQNGSLFYAQTINLVIPRREKAKRDTLALLMQKDLAIIVEDQNGLYFLLGEANGMLVSDIASTSGKAKGDLNGYTITLTGEEPVAAMEVDSSIIAGLL